MGPQHLKRFLRYASKVFAFRALVKGYDDYRQHPQIAPAQVLLAAFWLWIFQWRSFNQLERRMTDPAWRHLQLVPGRPGSVDTLAYALKRADLPALRQALTAVIRRAHRTKTWAAGTVGRWCVVAIDGTELHVTRRRHCSECCVRRVGPPQAPLPQYYHRAVLAQLVGKPPRMLLDVEPILPGEGERDAGRRLLTRVLEAHGRWIDLVVADAEYAAADWINRVGARVWVLIRLKDRRFTVVQDAEGLLAGQPPLALWRREDGQEVQAWEIWDMTSWEGVERPLRVVRFREPSPDGVVREHLFATTCPRQVGLQDLWRCAHARWDIENTAIHDLKHHWHASHCFVHDPTAMEALLLIGLLAVNLLWAYTYRHLVPHGLRLSVSAVVDALVSGYHQLTAPLRWAIPNWDTS